jgi:hypothetical protein
MVRQDLVPSPIHKKFANLGLEAVPVAGAMRKIAAFSIPISTRSGDFYLSTAERPKKCDIFIFRSDAGIVLFFLALLGHLFGPAGSREIYSVRGQIT